MSHPGGEAELTLQADIKGQWEKKTPATCPPGCAHQHDRTATTTVQLVAASDTDLFFPSGTPPPYNTNVQERGPNFTGASDWSKSKPLPPFKVSIRGGSMIQLGPVPGKV